MRPQWFPENNIPYNNMWADDYLWFPYLLKGQCFYGYFYFSDMKTIHSYTLDKIDNVTCTKIPTAPLNQNF